METPKLYYWQQTKTLKRDDIINIITQLSRSQGFYGRLLRRLKDLHDENPEEYDNLMTEWEEEGFTDELDLILYFET